MQQKLLDMMGDSKPIELANDTHLSFKPFLDYVRSRLSDENTVKKEVLRYVVDQFAQHPELEGRVDPASLADKKDLLDIVYASLSTIADDETKIHWGMSVPMTPLIFYGSNSFYDLLEKANSEVLDCEADKLEEAEFRAAKLQHFYSIVLDKFYGIQFRNSEDIIRNITDPVTGLTKHYKINLDTRFVNFEARSTLPQMNADLLRSRLVENDPVASLLELLPVDQFTFSGFSVITIEDVTVSSAVESIRSKIVNNTIDYEHTGFPDVVRSLKELVSSNEVEFNIIPFLKVNGKLVDDFGYYSPSVLFKAGTQKGCTIDVCVPMIQKFVDHPKLLYYADLEMEVPKHKELSELFDESGVRSYSLLPVSYNNGVVGALEIYSYKKGLVNEKVFSMIDPAMPLIAQLMQNTLTRFEDQIEATIKEKFTTLQPPVQWKFNEVAWKYIEQRKLKGSSAEPEDIVFENVYPLYGAVDIRNSTIERNAALAEDLIVQFNTLIAVLTKLKDVTNFGLLDEKIFSSSTWLNKIADSAVFNEEIRLNDFHENEMMPFLQEFVKGQPGLQAIVKPYFDSIDEVYGIAQQNRRELEKSMTTVISAVNNYFEMLRTEIQHAYPCYFDKFRTDGVEYDIYIGQSITPDKPYSEIYLKNLRLLQLSSMATIAKYSHSLQPLLLRPVDTTQLIFIHSNPIDIRFRRDEKRFDVEGAYNIRYHIIKKRIDKVHVHHSGERLTQPGKIALVYFNQREADEYVSYIHYLQGQGVLADDLETLDLEELQGVSGLKALRVGVIL